MGLTWSSLSPWITQRQIEIWCESLAQLRIDFFCFPLYKLGLIHIFLSFFKFNGFSDYKWLLPVHHISLNGWFSRFQSHESMLLAAKPLITLNEKIPFETNSPFFATKKLKNTKLNKKIIWSQGIYKDLIILICQAPNHSFLHCPAKTWIYLTPYVCTEQIFDSRPFMSNEMLLKKLF